MTVFLHSVPQAKMSRGLIKPVDVMRGCRFLGRAVLAPPCLHPSSQASWVPPLTFPLQLLPELCSSCCLRALSDAAVSSDPLTPHLPLFSFLWGFLSDLNSNHPWASHWLNSSVLGLHTIDSSDFVAGISCLWTGAGKWMPAFIPKIVWGHGVIRIKVALLIFRWRTPDPHPRSCDGQSQFSLSLVSQPRTTRDCTCHPKSKHLILFSSQSGFFRTKI